MDAEVRRLGREDFGLALALDENVRPGWVRGSGEGLRSFLADERAWLFAAVLDGKPMGFAYGWECPRPDGRRMLYIHEIAVAESARRRGIGRSLVDGLLRECAARGIDKMFLFTQRDNAAANALYRAMGGGVSPDSHGDDTVYWFRVKQKTIR